MKLSDLVTHITIDPRKLTAYALNPQNESGKHKAHIFKQKLGYSQDNYEFLLAQIEAQALETEVTLLHRDNFGQRVRLDLPVQGVNEEQEAIVRTGWLIPPDSDEAQLITLYVR
jgi:hypothetical protein